MRKISRSLSIAAIAALIGGAAIVATAPANAAQDNTSFRPTYHLSIPSGVGADIQRPVWDGDHYTMLMPNATAWGDSYPASFRGLTSADGVSWQDHGVAIPGTAPWGRVWTGSTIIDTSNASGLGAGTYLTYVTQDPGGTQAVFLWYSTDQGLTYSRYGTTPLLANPGTGDWRDPKVIWDADRSRWVMTIMRHFSLEILTSTDLLTWTLASTWTEPVANRWVECPDLFQMRGSDNQLKWVIGGSTPGSTFTYYVGSFDGTTFTIDPANSTPQLLDFGTDWFAGVTWADPASSNQSTRYAQAWLDAWAWAQKTSLPTWPLEGYLGQYSIPRQITLVAQPGGGYQLYSQPTPALDSYVSRLENLGDFDVSGTTVLPYTGRAYELSATVTWSSATNVGFSLRRSPNGSNRVDVGVTTGPTGYEYVNRSYTGNPQQSESRVTRANPTSTTTNVRILVDNTSVEVFFDGGRHVISQLIFPDPQYRGIALHSTGGTATFQNVTIREFSQGGIVAPSGATIADFDSSSYGSWSTTGTAFGTAPSTTTLPGQQTVTGYQGGYANSFHGGNDTSVGALISPAFTIDKSYLTFRVGGGDHPLDSQLFADFTGATWGSGWTGTGSFASQGPVGDQLDTSVNGGVSATGTITSPTFTITRDTIDFLVAGGAANTAVDLLVGGTQVLTTSGTSTVAHQRWDVHSWIGRSAQLRITDTNSTGRILVDQIAFGAAGAAAPLVWNGSNSCVDRDGTTGKVQIWTCLGTSNQLWRPQPNGTIKVGTQCLETVAGGTANGTLVAVGACSSGAPSPSQVWATAANGGLMNAAAGRCLDLDSGNTTNGRQLQIWACNGGGNQKWSAPAAVVQLVVGGQVVRSATGATDEVMRLTSWDVDGLIGSSAQIRVVDDSKFAWGHLEVDSFMLADRPFGR